MPGVCPGGGDVEVSSWSAHYIIWDQWWRFQLLFGWALWWRYVVLSNTPTICLCSKTSTRPTGITTTKRISSFSKSKWRTFPDGSHLEFRGCCFQLKLIAGGILKWWNTTIFLLVEYMTTGQITLRFVISALPPRIKGILHTALLFFHYIFHGILNHGLLILNQSQKEMCVTIGNISGILILESVFSQKILYNPPCPPLKVYMLPPPLCYEFTSPSSAPLGPPAPPPPPHCW